MKINKHRLHHRRAIKKQTKNIRKYFLSIMTNF